MGRPFSIAQEGADVLIASEKSDIGGSLEEVPDEDIDRDLSFSRLLKKSSKGER